MIEIYTRDDLIVIKPLDQSGLKDAAALYNSGSDTRYATGFEGELSSREISLMLERIKTCENEFIAGIYIDASDITGGTALSFVGLCSGMVGNGSIWIKQLSIIPESRRNGIGTRTVKMVLENAVRSYGVHDAYLSVVKENNAGLCFWNKLGFREIHRIEKVLFSEEKPYNVIILHKRLI